MCFFRRIIILRVIKPGEFVGEKMNFSTRHKVRSGEVRSCWDEKECKIYFYLECFEGEGCETRSKICGKQKRLT